MTSSVTRRQMLAGTGVLTTTAILGSSRAAFAALQVQVESVSVISQQPDYYCGWATVGRRKNGELLVVYSGGRQRHVCPFGRVEMMRSKDNGQTWSWPRVLIDSPIDDRDAGVLETSKGSILVTSFTSPEWEEHLRPGTTPPKPWQGVLDRITPEQREKALRVWMVRSTDGGVTFSAPYDTLVSSPHGPIELSDGRLLYAGQSYWSDAVGWLKKNPGKHRPHSAEGPNDRIGVCESTDDGQTWRWLAEIQIPEGEDRRKYCELHAVEAADGRIVVLFRNHNKGSRMRQTESTDGGRTWSVPRSSGVHGHPPHLMRLQDDRLLLTYGYRDPPKGVRVCISENNGRDWSEPSDLIHDTTSPDLGYPSSVQLDDGSLITVWYEKMKGSNRAVIRQARWSLES